MDNNHGQVNPDSRGHVPIVLLTYVPIRMGHVQAILLCMAIALIHTTSMHHLMLMFIVYILYIEIGTSNLAPGELKSLEQFQSFHYHTVKLFYTNLFL